MFDSQFPAAHLQVRWEEGLKTAKQAYQERPPPLSAQQAVEMVEALDNMQALDKLVRPPHRSPGTPAAASCTQPPWK